MFARTLANEVGVRERYHLLLRAVFLLPTIRFDRTHNRIRSLKFAAYAWG